MERSAGALAGARGLHPRVRRGLDSFLAYSARLRSLDRASLWSGLILAPLALIACFALLKLPASARSPAFPPASSPWPPTPTFPAAPACSLRTSSAAI